MLYKTRHSFSHFYCNKKTKRDISKLLISTREINNKFLRAERHGGNITFFITFVACFWTTSFQKNFRNHHIHTPHDTINKTTHPRGKHVEKAAQKWKPLEMENEKRSFGLSKWAKEKSAKAGRKLNGNSLIHLESFRTSHSGVPWMENRPPTLRADDNGHISFGRRTRTREDFTCSKPCRVIFRFVIDYFVKNYQVFVYYSDDCLMKEYCYFSIKCLFHLV